MDGTLEKLRQKVRLTPEGPGIYIHRDRNGEVLYVGKARNLRNRLRSYFFGTERLPLRIRQLVARIADFDVVLSQSENESLVLESQFIKSHKPPFNVLLKDSKGYPYVRINLKEDWPTVRMVRRRREDGALYLGPFPAGSSITDILAVIRRHFPLVKCSPQVFRSTPRPCNYYHMKQCLAPCHLNVDPKEYRRHVDAAIGLLRGQVRRVKGDLESLMHKAASSEDFERAALYRDEIRAIEGLGQTQNVDLDLGFDAELVAVFWGSDLFAFSIMTLRGGKVVDNAVHTSPYSLESAEQSDEAAGGGADRRAESLVAALRLVFLGRQPAKRLVILDREGVWHSSAGQILCAFLEAVYGGNQDDSGSRISQPFRVLPGCEALLADLPKVRGRSALRSSLESLENSLFDTARQKYQHDKMLSSQAEQMLLGLQTFLGLPSPPTWIECYDISTFQGSETVASQVVFRDGKPSKKHYRRYVIRSLETQDDFGSLREVLGRRLREAAGAALPDLLLIDGGEPQVREVLKVLTGLELETIRVVGIAKSRTRRSFAKASLEKSAERLVMPVFRGDGARSFETRELRVGSPEYRLVTQMRDEAHRFAITFHRARRDKRSKRGLLDGIAGLGPKRKRALLDAYPDPKTLMEASHEEVAARTGLSPTLVEVVRGELGKRLETLKPRSGLSSDESE